MVSKCCNPACNCVFRELSKGRLFLLPPAHFHSDSIKLSDYCYWLCPECDAAYTVTRLGPEIVVSERGPGDTHFTPAVTPRGKRPRQITLRSYTEAG